MPKYDPEYLNNLAEQTERAAAQLRHEATHAAEVVEGQAGDHDAAAFASRKTAAADRADQHAKSLREQADAGISLNQRDFDDAKLVTHAAEMGGYLIDPANRKAGDSGYGDVRAEQAYLDEQQQAFERSGAFTRVKEPGQIGYYQLSSPATAAAAAATDDDADTDGI